MEQSKKEMIALQSTEKKDSSSDKLAMLRQGNVSLILDSYDDLFSDFDPRPYSERALSDDFLVECKRATRERTNSEVLELRLLVPKNKRDIDDEIKIKRRLRSHFTKHYNEKQKEVSIMKKEGLVWFLCGIIFILFATILSEREGFAFQFLFVVFEPAGWFTTWTGLQKMFLDVREKMPESHFYEKMGKMQIMFYSY
jgi:hypothetical protein